MRRHDGRRGGWRNGRRDRWFGHGPLRPTLLLTSFVLTGYAGVRLLAGDWLWVTAWFVGAALVHDLVLLPLYALADRALRAAVPAGRHRRTVLNCVRVPAVLSGLLLLVWFPLITRQVAAYEAITGLSAEVYLGRWLLVTAVLFAGSGGWLAYRLSTDRRREVDAPSAE
ncbi:hypothetical protein [Streptomyces oceani]|uniref:Uncharacterized protein n=1 Tax=Streptomyces oceani TaxID=1075402 RepID=A0A1E7KM12_9ACTN|nr:hypothetical protein [Streptomyces oceani]OEV04937.1 hypothetical protein AN216_04765 [Streptomyces oceani]